MPNISDNVNFAVVTAYGIITTDTVIGIASTVGIAGYGLYQWRRVYWQEKKNKREQEEWGRRDSERAE